MKRFCGKCGAEIEGDAKFCPSCGEAVEVTPSANKSEADTQGVNIDKNKMIGIIVCVVVVIALIGLSSLLFGQSAKTAVTKYANASAEFDIKTALKYSAVDEKKLLKVLQDEYGVNDKDLKAALKDEYGAASMDALYKQAQKETLELLEDFYGKKFKIKSKVLDVETLSKSKAQNEIDKVDNWYVSGVDDIRDILRGKIKQVAKVKIEMTINYDGKKEDYTQTVYCGKIGGKWYVLDGGTASELASTLRGVLRNAN